MGAESSAGDGPEPQAHLAPDRQGTPYQVAPVVAELCCRAVKLLRTSTSALLAVLAFAACGPEAAAPPAAPQSPGAPAQAGPAAAAPDEPRPALRLPADVHPSAEAVELTVRPEQDRFSGRVDIDVTLDHARRSIWLHGHGLHVASASVTPEGGAAIPASWADEDDRGLGRLALASDAPAGRARIHVEYDAPFVAGNKGLFKVTEAGTPYVFTQFEATDARLAFPCFDEPSFKIPFTATLIVPEGDQAISNTPESARESAGQGLVRVHFATTKPLPSYLVAFAVGPLDVVKAPDVPPNGVRTRPLPLRGVAAKGRGPELAYALAHAGEILSALEAYFGIEYPYEKMDILAVPEMSGAMENAGAVTFDEPLLMFDPKTAPIWQRAAYVEVVAHEFSHQWFGDLVTMAWWDDTWLNESFAEWMGYKISQQWDPSLQGDLSLANATQNAIGTDSLVSARQIHQPIATADDIENSFDDITYQKGGSVIAMFERWLGPDVFQKGVRQHLAQHRFGNATADDFLSALSSGAGRDVGSAYRTFIDQPGVPFIEAEVRCSGGAAPQVHLKQSRFLPRGSSGDAGHTWQVPVCLKYPVAGAGHDAQTKQTCTLLTAPEADVALETSTCPAWVFPNAHGTGYYRFALASADLANVRSKALPSLDARERIAFGNSLRAAFNHGSTPYGEVLLAAEPLATDADPRVASEPGGFVGMAHEWLATDPLRPRVEAFARKLAQGPFAKLGWTKHKGEMPDTMELRSEMLGFLLDTGRDPALRAEAKRRAAAYVGFHKDGAIHPDAVDENLAGNALWAAGQDADAAFFDALLAAFTKATDDVVRQRLLGALSAARDPKLAARARDLVLDDRLKHNEMLQPLWAQLGQPETREDAWKWLQDHWDAVAARASSVNFMGVQLVSMPGSFCDEAHEKQVADFMHDRAAKLDGGPRVLASTLEQIHLCVAKRSAEEPNVRAFFAKK
ncbi:MAG TPA: M1 family metallopeptidase [Polyangiaceae bacterium]